MKIFNKSDLAHDVAAILGISPTAANQVITEALHLILGAAAVGDAYRLQGFGTFKPKTTAARTGRNPRTGEAVEIAARTSLSFKPAKAWPAKAGKAVV